MKQGLKIVVCLLAAFGAVASAHAENFVVDGGFESGGLSSWYSQGNVAVQTNPAGQQTEGTHSAIFNADGTEISGVISQNITLPSIDSPCWLQFYYGTFAQVRGQAIRYYVSCGGATVASGLVYATSSMMPYAQLFHPTSTTVNITFVDVSAASNASAGVLDAVLVQRLPSYALPGKYAGSELRTIAFPDQNISSSETRKLTARISSYGEISILEQPGSISAAHLVVGAGTMFVLGTDGDFAMVKGTLKGSTLTYSFNTSSLQPSSGRPVTYTHSFNLHKVGP